MTEVFGSERNGLAFPVSDIDIRFVPIPREHDPFQERPPPTQEDRDECLRHLRRLFKKFHQEQKEFLNITLRHARYPLIAMYHRPSGLDIQIVLANDSAHQRNIIQLYMDDIPFLRKVYFLIRTMLDIRGLTDVFRGGFGSYSLFMMVVASIKLAPEPPRDAASALRHVLKFYADFDTYKKAISIDPPYIFDKAAEPIVSPDIRAKIDVN